MNKRKKPSKLEYLRIGSEVILVRDWKTCFTLLALGARILGHEATNKGDIWTIDIRNAVE
ncbi:hypothetical protein C4552_03210 [Candidatus Parcubacteria bacterium]|nr:MAG: hypothetical protein C4552_03210 [Candidatus Parcubacteria bacterium]